MRKPILKENRSYTFSDYFELANPTREVVAEFGYTFELRKLELPKAPIQKAALAKLRDTFYAKLPHISINSEIARREFLIAPLFFELLDYVAISVDVEYPLDVNEKLRGTLDYLLRSTHSFVVVEAKNADLERGFTQLAVELIALDQYLSDSTAANDLIYGAVTVGDIWRFGILDRKTQLISKDIDAFMVPANLDTLFAVLIGILSDSEGPKPQ